ncbi:DUF11 domain-containing protein [Spirosoma sp. BT702]|uniref:DUF11 domain-containing protein n=1 Tax=Spirosoma profusum TaxID=2771354 RepID=A0A927AN44_9BACT|nr:DUF11 domain-containing protein [Spirosoma profusum]MBD2701084.1 DUF11 domain-containing protein [Spirosoma profusum]
MSTCTLTGFCRWGNRTPTDRSQVSFPIRNNLIAFLLKLVKLEIIGLLLLGMSVAQAQYLQWSTSAPNKHAGQGVAHKIGPDGAIYVLTEGQNNASGYSTGDIKEFGPPLWGAGGGYNAILSKYSPDGNTLLWVRIFNGGDNSSFAPLDFELAPNGELVLLCSVNGSDHVPALITPNGFQTSPSNGNVAILMKLSPDGKTINYGTYLGSVNGGANERSRFWNESPYFQNLIVAPDGAMILMLQNQTWSGALPTTPNAYQAMPKGGSDDPYMAIFNQDGTLRYASYYSTNAPGAQFPTDILADADGSFHVTYRNGNGHMLPVTPGTAYATPSLANQVGYIGHYNSSGQLMEATSLPGTQVQGIRKRPNGNIVVMGVLTTPAEFTIVGSSPYTASQNGQLTLTEFDPTLRTVIRSVVISPGNVDASDMEIDEQGRIHISGKANAAGAISPTPGALHSSFGNNNTYYLVVDCNFDKVLYATYLNTGENNATTGAYDLELSGCRATILATAGSQQPYPVTPIGLANDGTSTLTGYNLTANPEGSTVYLTAFNFAKYVPTTNTIAATVTSYCEGAGLFPITGSRLTYTTPTLKGVADANPAPYSLYYQWQSSASMAGPWTDIPGATTKDYTPVSLTAGSVFFRRAGRQTPFDATCSPAASCVETNYSNVVEYTVSGNKAASTNLASQPYGICSGATLSLNVVITPGSDGDHGAYAYQLSPLGGGSPVFSGTVATSATPITLPITTEGEFWLNVTDSRGCTSYDTLKTLFFDIKLPARTVFTCGNSSVTLGPPALPPTYANVPTNTFSWSPTAGLDNPNGINPRLSNLPAPGASQDYYLDFNGCRIDTVTVTNQSVTPLPMLPSLTVCQGDTVRLGQGLTVQAGVDYRWAPGLGIADPASIHPLLTASFAPQGANTLTYTVQASNGVSGCLQTTNQQVTIFKTPNNAFNHIQPYVYCAQAGPPAATHFGTPSETGIMYSWTAVVTNLSATQGVPTPEQALTFLNSTTASNVSMQMPGSGIPNGGLADGAYDIMYIRTSQNTVNGSCARADTAILRYMIGCGPGGDFCQLDQKGGTEGQCGGSTTTIGPITTAANGIYTWSPVAGLSDPNTGLPLTPGGPHPARVIANPSGLVAIVYTLALALPGVPDTCRVFVKVFPAQASLPVTSYSSPLAACKGSTVQIQETPIPGYTYQWTPGIVVNDSTIANPTTLPLTSDKTLYVNVTDAATGCSVRDTVAILVTPIDNSAGADGTYCEPSGGSVTIGTAAKSGYTYSWFSPTTGVTFTSTTSAITNVTIAPNTPGPILFIRNATNGNTSANCSYADTVYYRPFTSLSLRIPTPGRLCNGGGGSIIIGPVSDPNLTYLWSTGETTAQISVSATGMYSVTAGQGLCIATANVDVQPAIEPTVNFDASPIPVPCNGPLLIGVNNSPDGGWSYSWSPFTDVSSSARDMSTISVFPSAPTEYTLTANHVTGCVKTFVFPVPAASYVAILPTSLNFCEGDGRPREIPLNVPPQGSTVTWIASPASATAYLSSVTDSRPIFDITSASAGTYSYTATVTYGNGCVSTVSVLVKVGKAATVLAGEDKTVCLGNCVQIGTPARIGYSYEWTTIPYDATKVAQISNRTSAMPTVCPTSNTTYQVSYYDASSGCSFSDDLIVQATTANPTLTVKNLNVACQNASGNATFDLANAILTNTGTTTSYFADATASIPVANPISLPTTYYIKSVSSDGFCSTVKPVSVSFTAFADVKAVATSPVCSTNGTGTSVKGYVTLSDYVAGSTYQYVEGIDFATGTKIPASPANLTGFSSVIIQNLDDTVLPKTYTIRVFNPTDPTCYSEKQVTAQPSGCCFKPVAGPDQTICAPATTANVTAAGAGETWSVQTGNPATASITQQGEISGMTADGTYHFILTVGTGCTDTLQIIRSTPISLTVSPGQCNTVTNQYTVSGTVSLTNAQLGDLIISDGTASTTLTIANSTTTVPFSFSGLTSDGASHTVVAMLSSCGMNSATYTAPQPCLQPIVKLEKQVDKSRARQGDTLTYALILTNEGSAPATNIVVRDSTSNGMTYLANSAAVPASTTFNQGVPVSTWLVASLSPGQSLSMTFQVRADSSGILYNTASIPGDTAIACTSIPVKVCAGEQFTFLIMVPPGRSSYTWLKDGQPIQGQTTNTLSITAVGTYSLLTNNSAGNCPDFSCCPFILEEEPVPSFNPTSIAATCLGSAVQSNGQLVLTDFDASHTYQYSAGATFDAANVLSGAAATIPANGVLVNTLANPAASQFYTVRVYNSTGCYRDVTVVLDPTVCACPADRCVPFVVQQTKRPPRIGGR